MALVLYRANTIINQPTGFNCTLVTLRSHNLQDPYVRSTMCLTLTLDLLLLLLPLLPQLLSASILLLLDTKYREILHVKLKNPHEPSHMHSHAHTPLCHDQAGNLYPHQGFSPVSSLVEHLGKKKRSAMKSNLMCCCS